MKVFVDTAAVMEKPLAGKRRPRLAGQAHQSGVARIRLVAVSRRDLHHARSAGRRGRAGQLRHLPRLSRHLPDRGVPGALPARCAALHFLSDHRAQGPDPARIPRRDGQPHLWLRRLPRGLPVEQVRACRAARRSSPRATRCARPTLAELARLDDAQFRALFAKTSIKRTGRDRFVRNVLIAIGNSGDAALARRSRAPARRRLAAGARRRGVGAVATDCRARSSRRWRNDEIRRRRVA